MKNRRDVGAPTGLDLFGPVGLIPASPRQLVWPQSLCSWIALRKALSSQLSVLSSGREGPSRTIFGLFTFLIREFSCIRECSTARGNCYTT